MPPKNKRPIVLLGYPLEHSLSPLIHNTAFEYQGLDYHYSLHPVSPDNLESDLHRLLDHGLVGANVTVPHKQAVVRLIDEGSDVVKTIGAANTISRRLDGVRTVLVGDNSDVGGFIAPLRELLPQIDGKQVLIFGSGGAAKAVAFALLKYASPSRLIVAARTSGAATGLVNIMTGLNPACSVDFVHIDQAASEVRRSTLIVNATPLGMGATTDRTIWTDTSDFHDRQIVYDLIYWPLETRLLQDAKARGARTIGGLDMLIEQAAISYSIWTDRKMPVDVVRQAVQRYLGTRG